MSISHDSSPVIKLILIIEQQIKEIRDSRFKIIQQSKQFLKKTQAIPDLINYTIQSDIKRELIDMTNKVCMSNNQMMISKLEDLKSTLTNYNYEKFNNKLQDFLGWYLPVLPTITKRLAKLMSNIYQRHPFPQNHDNQVTKDLFLSSECFVHFYENWAFSFLENASNLLITHARLLDKDLPSC